MKSLPLFDRLVVERVEEEQQSVIVTPEMLKEKPLRARVVAAGPGRVTEEGIRIPMTVRVGDLVLFGKYTGQEIKLAGKDYLIMHEADVVLILKEE